MYVVTKKTPAESSRKIKQAEHVIRDHPKHKQLIANTARHRNKRPPSQKGKRERTRTHIQLAAGGKTIIVSTKTPGTLTRNCRMLA